MPCSTTSTRKCGPGRRSRTRSRAQGDLFPRVYTASLLAGERSGNLDAVLRRYVEYAKIIATLKRKIVSALVYPAILIALALVLVSIIVLRVVPAFADFYAGFGAELPLATRIIMTVSAFVTGTLPPRGRSARSRWSAGRCSGFARPDSNHASIA